VTVLPPPAPGCESCAARDVVIAEQGAAIAELRSDLVAPGFGGPGPAAPPGPQQRQFVDAAIGR